MLEFYPLVDNLVQICFAFLKSFKINLLIKFSFQEFYPLVDNLVQICFASLNEIQLLHINN